MEQICVVLKYLIFRREGITWQETAEFCHRIMCLVTWKVSARDLFNIIHIKCKSQICCFKITTRQLSKELIISWNKMQLTIAHPQEVVLASTIKRFLKTKNTEYWAVRDHQIPRVKMLFFKAQTIVTSFHVETPSSTKQNICEHFSRTTVSNTSDSIKNGVPPEHNSEKHNVLLPVCQWF